MLDLTKPVQTRAGRPARILATDRQAGIYTVVALRKDRDIETVSVYTPDGRFYTGQEDHPYDLVNVPEEVTRYFVVTDDGGWVYGVDVQAYYPEAHVIAVTFVDGKVTACTATSPTN